MMTRSTPFAVNVAAGSAENVSALTPTKRLQFGVVGYGYWGPQLVRNLGSLAGSSISFIADLDEERLAQAQAYYSQTKLTRTVADLLDSGIDAIVDRPQSARTILWHAPRCWLVKHVFVEKPLVVTTAQVEEALARERNRVLMVGYTFLYHRAVEKPIR